MNVKALMPVAWLLSGAGFVFFVAQPVGTANQLTVSMTLMAAMMLLWLTGRRPESRMLFIMLAIGIVGRYVYWRTTSTLPSPDNLVNFVPGLVLYLVEMFSVAMLLISTFVVAHPKDRAKAPLPAEDDLMTVDVFVPSYNEKPDLLAVTLAAATAMDYPRDKLRVYLLDDGGTDQKCQSSDPVAAHAARERRAELRKLCGDLGATYLTRERNVSAKAGNMNAALPRTEGDLVAVFDADHAPTRDFLKETVGHFAEDQRLFLVQTPHFFLNPDPIEKNLSLFKSMPSENEMFYGVIQKGLDSWNAAFFCGSAAVLRRAALEEVGGFQGVTITEDCETALTLHARGWNSRYVDKPMIAGLQPETFATFIGQRSRWCQGMLQILMLKNPIFRGGLSLAQRICYLSSSLFWLFSITRLTFVAAPLLHIFFSLEIYEANLTEFIAFTCTYMVANMMLQNYLYGDVRWPWMSELYEYIQSVYLVKSIVSVVLNPKRPTFNVTAKGTVIDKEKLSELALPYFIIFAILFAAAVVAGLRWWSEPASRDLLTVVSIWNGLNLVIAGLALGAVSEKSERRRNQRLPVVRNGTIVLGGNAYDVVIEDVSSGGAHIRPLGARFASAHVAAKIGTLAITSGPGSADVPVLPVAIRRKVHDGRGLSYGIEFLDLSAAQFCVVADLMYSGSNPLAKIHDERRKSVGVIGGSVRILGWSISNVTRALALAGRRSRPAAADIPSLPEPAAAHASPSSLAHTS